ncbi:MAG: DUF2786 domain-containing protein, partial [Actinomycetes bacterium]
FLAAPVPGAVETQVLADVPFVDAWVTSLRLALRIEGLPALASVVSPPSSWAGERVFSRPTDRHPDRDRDRTMAKIRALLAKAEATEYRGEAEVFTAKAQELMTRHAIDEALLRAEEQTAVGVATARIHLEAPYVSEKVSLLHRVAVANRAKTVWHRALAMATLVGTPVDLDQIELLFTSLLIQATRAMAEAGAAGPGAVDRSASFRRSFLASYAHRIGQRLKEASAATTSSYGSELVPVLANQAEAVEEAYERLFPHTYARSSRARYSQRGWEAGRAAADRATIVAGRLAAS